MLLMSYGIKVAPAGVCFIIFFCVCLRLCGGLRCCCRYCFLTTDRNGRPSDPSAALLPPSERERLRVVLQPHLRQVGTHTLLQPRVCALLCVCVCVCDLSTAGGCR